MVVSVLRWVVLVLVVMVVVGAVVLLLNLTRVEVDRKVSRPVMRLRTLLGELVVMLLPVVLVVLMVALVLGRNSKVSRMSSGAKAVMPMMVIPESSSKSLNTVHIGFCDYGLSGQSGFSDRKPLDGPPSVHK